MDVRLVKMCRHDYLVIWPKLLRQFQSDLVRNLRRDLVRFETLVAVKSKDAVLLSELPFGHLHLLPRTERRAVPAGNIVLLLRLGIVHGVVHDIAHRLVIDAAPCGILRFLRILCVIEDVPEAALNRPYLCRRH